MMAVISKVLRYHSKWRPLLQGIFFAWISVSLSIYVLSPRQSLELHALVLVLAATVYLGAALSAGSEKELRQEGIQAFVFYLFTLAGLWVSPVWLGVGYVLHIVWDLSHHPEHIRTKIADWVPPLCLTYDLIVAVYIFLVH